MNGGKLLTGTAIILAFNLTHAPAAEIHVAWENLDGTATPPAAVLLDADGLTPLPGGTDTVGDGAIVALGYFTGATELNPFAGEWVPLTGPQAGNIPLQKTSVGDSGDGTALADGFFTLESIFDSEDSAVYQRIPAPGTPLCIAVYNRATVGGSTHFNIAAHPDWQWPEALPFLPAFVFLNPTAAGTTWFGGGASALRTALPTTSFPGGAARAPARLANISTRAWVGTGDAVMIPGFVLQGSGSTELLIRAAGPTLAASEAEGGLGVPGGLADPALQLIRQLDGARIAENDDWQTQPGAGAIGEAVESTGAFPFLAASRDSAILRTLPVSPGGYTVLVGGNAQTTGIALAEIYLTDTSPDAPAELINISTRGFVRTGDEIMIPGFVVAPGGPRRLLIRASGPSWASLFNLGGVLANPRVSVVPSNAPDTVLASNEDWSDNGQAEAIAAAAAQVGAFDFQVGWRDAALVLQLPASNVARGFTVLVSDSDGGTGLVLTEVYALP